MSIERFRELIRRCLELRSVRWAVFSLLGIRVPVPVRVSGIGIAVRPKTTDLRVALTSLGGEFDDLLKICPPLKHNIIIDAGGYIGTAAIAFARQYPEAKIYCLEPSRAHFGILLRNVSAWPQIIPMRLALAAQPGSTMLHDTGNGAWAYTLLSTSRGRINRPIETVDGITVEQLLTRIGAEGVDIFKLDIEGAEFDLFRHNADWVDRIGALCIELHDRYQPGCTAGWQNAVAGRINLKLPGEKHVSLRPT